MKRSSRSPSNSRRAVISAVLLILLSFFAFLAVGCRKDNEQEPVQFVADGAILYVCETSNEPLFSPKLYLNPEEGTFFMSVSMLSSQLYAGAYTEEDGTVRLSNGSETYVFHRNGDALVFDAGVSASLPKYRYAADDPEARPPFEDGAVSRTGAQPPEAIGAFYGTAWFDVDGDGVSEMCSMGMGRTSGVFTFTFTAAQDGETEYSCTFLSEFLHPSFEESEDGTVRVRGETQHEIPEVHYFDISVRDNHIVLTEDGEELLCLDAE